MFPKSVFVELRCISPGIKTKLNILVENPLNRLEVNYHIKSKKTFGHFSFRDKKKRALLS